MSEDSKEKPPERSWARIAHRFSGRGRIRSVFLILALVLSKWNPISAGIGLGVFILGMFVHGVSKGNLVRNKQLCTNGPYKWVRHPFYVANFLIDLSLCLMAGAPWLALAYAIAFPLAYLPRIFAEEESLREHFGPAFDEYCKSTPRLLPRSIPRLIAWTKSSSYECMRLENELSRLTRLAGYPFFIAAVILGRERWQHDQPFESLFACALAVSLALWCAGALIHRHLEDGKPVAHPKLSQTLAWSWLLVPLLPLLHDRLALWLEITPYEAEVQIAGKALLVAGVLALMALRRATPGWGEGFALALLALSCGLVSGQIVIAPLLACLIWSSWFLAAQSASLLASSAPVSVSSVYPRWLPGIAVLAFIVSIVAWPSRP
jgi:hypothetical protein